MNFLSKPSGETLMAAQAANMGQPVQEPSAIAPMPRMSASERDRMEAMARQHGFQNYEQMRLFILRRQQGTGAEQAPPKRISLDDAMAWHPRNLLTDTYERIKKAVGQ